ncbi:MAG: MBL fold metallo-hydrolase [Candidatus Omnitrophota bacterium]|nr:MAG: MBL fold metallo-hydrolase [Candidatus Omnitrophota bacterium]
MILETICVGQMQVNCYILAAAKNKQAIIIDPGEEKIKIKSVLDKNRLSAGIIVNTHGHIDHIACDDEFSVPVYIHSKDAELLRNAELNLSSFMAAPFEVKSEIRAVEDKDEISLDEITLEVIHTPGHTPGGMALLLKKPKAGIVFTGDTLFYHGIGRTDFPGASEKELFNSVKNKLFRLKGDLIVLPGHGPSSTVKEEKENNPFFNSGFSSI